LEWDDRGSKRFVESIDQRMFELKILPIQDKFSQDFAVLTGKPHANEKKIMRNKLALSKKSL
jgi:hypothetical protein